MNRQFFAAPLLLTATLLCTGQVRAQGTQFQTVRAATANDVINEMLAAGRSRQPTIIRLGDLQDDGVPGNTHYPPLAGSPLIDAGGSVGPTCSPTDQIGQRRVEGDADNDGANVCDVGAIEFQPPAHH